MRTSEEDKEDAEDKQEEEEEDEDGHDGHTTRRFVGRPSFLTAAVVRSCCLRKATIKLLKRLHLLQSTALRTRFSTEAHRGIHKHTILD